MLRPNLFFGALLTFISMAHAAPPPGAPADTQPSGERVWALTDYLKGTSAQIRDKLNAEVERLSGRVVEVSQNLHEIEKERASAEKTILDRVHASKEFKHAITDLAREQDLQTVRDSGTTEEKLAAGARFNQIRGAVDKLEKSELSKSQEIADDRKQIYDMGRQLAGYRESLAKATAWRAELITAIRTGFCLKAPVDVGSKGVLPDIIVDSIIDADHMMIIYGAPQLLQRGKDEEGIHTYSAEYIKMRILVGGVRTQKLKRGDKMHLDRAFKIEKIDRDADGSYYVAELLPADIDDLLKLVVPLHIAGRTAQIPTTQYAAP